MFDKAKKKSAKSFLQELRSNTAGNTLAMAGMALFPLAAMIGGGVDMSRIYLVQTRLQQACDAGALAGRRQMAGGYWGANNNAANTAANNMFRANFDTNAYGSYDGTTAFSENAGTVTGTATVKLDMAVMQMFGFGTKNVSVECDASMAIPNTDVMFVLDTTGSMNCPDTGSNYCGNNGDVEASNARIRGLRSAVKCFYETLAKRDSDEDCGSTPASGSENTAHLRFGFMPYSTNVNVGKLLPNDFLANNWTYQSREAVTRLENVVVDYEAGTPYVYGSTYYYDGSWSRRSTVDTHYNVRNSYACNSLQPDDYDEMSGNESGRFSESSWTSGGNRITRWYTDETGTRYDYSTQYSSSRDRCRIRLRTRTLLQRREYRQVDTPVYEQQQVFSHYDYKPVTFNVSGLKAGGSSWNNSIDLPIGNQGLDTGVTWDGCIEERQTVRTTNFNPIPTAAYDLDIDRVPTTGNPATQWGPLLEDAVWGRYGGYNNSRTTDTVSSSYTLSRNFSYTCANEARKLQRWDNPADFDNYLDDLDATGSTYHDIGLIWGARFLSPTGIFAAENATTDNGGAIDRHLIFMTDGDTVTSNSQYTSYGVEWYDRRRTSANSAPSSNDLTTQVNSRFLAMCRAIKNQNITLWVVSFGNGVSSSSITNLQNCATSGKFYNASNSAELLNNFRTIANDISQLRLTS
ncbi:MAG: pilus assembly protein TadG [Sphingomonadales bacterium]|nr:pilus assembly protein TadG [Sphingomonadales bacterium]NCP01538.1 pilus assembly protein TadG [Sphingomonadales bacterium]NCP44114.1 pilus assembly protein TadG [Sphingomonadales bacterium]NCP49844.1 pilus assembly protein TadG [Sphingomonadales bacterium]NCQ09427.1 pilus assembly protein TadG [Sphingomonadales bacterium]